MFLSGESQALPRRGGVLLLLAMAFAAGLALGVFMEPGNPRRQVDEPAHTGSVERAAVPESQGAVLRTGYPAEVLRVFDGDTFEARVRIWPGHDVTTKVRLRSIDTPEMKARCEDERVMANAARDMLVRLLAEGTVAISQVGLDKYGGRVDAEVSTAKTADVGKALVGAGLARNYNAGKRQSWCTAER